MGVRGGRRAPSGVALLLAAALSWAPRASAGPGVARPPQFVLLAFDGSLNLDMWRETLDFAAAADLKFTYFVSGVYFLLDARRHLYVEPTHGAGQSAIGFGGERPEEIAERIEWVNRAHAAGHEIASHVNGHFDGSRWTLAEWQSELEQFRHLLFDVAANNALAGVPGRPYRFGQAEIRGFRAPLLGENAAMYRTLAAQGYTYDTSKTSEPGYWPQRSDGLWNFPLAQLRIAGTARRTLSMDYNFYFAQSEGKPDPAHEEEYREEMLRTYLAYFSSNYLGNRAPVHIGHHFSKWNGGAYWRAMQEFARAVCHLPEVRCTTYRELESWLEALPAGALAAHRQGAFDKAEFAEARSALARAEAGLEAELAVESSESHHVVRATVSGPEADRVRSAPAATIVWKVDGRTIASGRRRSVDLARHRKAIGDASKLSVTVESRGKVLLKATHDLRKAPRGLRLSASPDEALALSGRHPGAHGEEKVRHGP